MNWPTLLNLATGGLIVLGAFWLVQLLTIPQHHGGPPRCARCGYPAIGLPGPRCPECGAALAAPGAVRTKPYDLRWWGLLAAGSGAAALALIGPIGMLWAAYQYEATGDAMLVPGPPSAPTRPWLEVEGVARGWHLLFLHSAQSELRLMCETRPSDAPTGGPRNAQSFDRSDALVIRPLGAWKTNAAAAEIVRWYARHGGNMDAAEGQALWQWLSTSADSMSHDGRAQLANSVMPSAIAAWRGGGSTGFNGDGGTPEAVLRVTIVALWCGGTWLIYRRARRRAGGFRADDLGNMVPLDRATQANDLTGGTS